MDFEDEVRPVIATFVTALEAALRAQLEARLFGVTPPPPRARRRVAARPAAAPRAPAAPVVTAPARDAGPRVDPTLARVLAFVTDNEGRTDEDGQPLRLNAAVVARHLALDPAVARAVLDHLTSTHQLERRGQGRAVYFVATTR